MTKIRRGMAGALATAVGGMLVSTAMAGQVVQRGWSVPGTLNMTFEGAVCDNTGSTVDISGALATGGAKVKLIFRNNVKGTKELVKLGEIEFEIVAGNGSVTIPKQPVLGGVGGNPHISFQAADSGWDITPAYVPFSERAYLGRCVQNFRTATEQTVELGGQLVAAVQAIECTKKGSSLTVDLEAARGAVVGSLFFDNNYNRVIHEADVEARANFSLTPSQFTSRRGWGAGGAGGNPLIYLQFLQSDNSAVGEEAFLGRCRDLL